MACVSLENLGAPSHDFMQQGTAQSVAEPGALPAGEAAGIGAVIQFSGLSNQPLQVLRKRTEQALRVRVVGEELDDVAAL